MGSSIEVRILQMTDLEKIQIFERALLKESSQDPVEAELESWTAPWRSESLQHYLPQGWSFAAFDSENQLVGYLIAQPILFFQRQTQTVWVEHLISKSEEVSQKLAEVIWRWCRDKHMQKLIFANVKVGEIILHSVGGGPVGHHWEVSTTRSRN